VSSADTFGENIVDNSANDGADSKIKAVSSADTIGDNIADNSVHGCADIQIKAVSSADTLGDKTTAPLTEPTSRPRR
jgi:hypothetical protein